MRKIVVRAITAAATSIWVVMRHAQIVRRYDHHFAGILYFQVLRNSDHSLTPWVILRKGTYAEVPRGVVFTDLDSSAHVMKILPEAQSRAVVTPPGSVLLKIADALLSVRTRERVIDPLVSDYRIEYFRALQQQRLRKAFYLKCVYTFFVLAGARARHSFPSR